MKGIAWRSLRTRIILLAIVTCVFLAIAAASFYSFLRSSHSKTVRATSRHLERVADTLAQTYVNQAQAGHSLQDVHAGPRPHPVPPPRQIGPPEVLRPPAHLPPTPPPPPPPDPLAQLTAGVLQREDGIEGGFLAGDGPLVGYAFPTHEGPGTQKEMPQRERPTIDRLAHDAAASNRLQTFTFEGQHDVVLFVAKPVREKPNGSTQSIVTGAVWLMQRLPEVNSGRARELLFASLGFSAAAIITALLAFVVTFEISGGVNAVMRRLGLLERELAPHAEGKSRLQLAEFEEVLGGIDALALSLKNRIENERLLEAELRHRERLSSLGQFAAGIAHELRNPLATIRLRAQMSQHGSGQGSVGHNSTIILEEVDRLDMMISRLLYFSRPIKLDLQALDLNDLLDSAVQSWRERPSAAGVVITFERGPSVIVSVDRNRLLQVLHNLIENAVQSASLTVSGSVVLSVAIDLRDLLIRIEDNGPGFSDKSLRHALDPFFTTRETGTGLGLSIAFELVQAHGGDLELANNPSGGALVIVHLPQPHRTVEASS